MAQEEFACPTCGEAFETGVELERHNRREHSQFKCEVCEQIFSSENDLESHNLVMHPERPASPKTW